MRTLGIVLIATPLLILAGCTAATPPASPTPTAEPATPTAAPVTASPEPATPAATPATATDEPATPAATPVTPTDEPTGEGASVSIIDLDFVPGALEVSVGTEVVWTNDGALPHTVTFEDGSADSGVMDAGDTYRRTFEAAGSFDYICSIHPAMTGTISVSE